MAKSPNYMHHRYGCKYRLICERDEARGERDKARTTARKLRDAYEPGDALPWENEIAMAAADTQTPPKKTTL
jgi:hypothetical protein